VKDENKFKVGDLVRLKSGGPVMTASEVDGASYNRIRCQWFGGKKLESGMFDIATLVPAGDDKDEEKGVVDLNALALPPEVKRQILEAMDAKDEEKRAASAIRVQTPKVKRRKSK